MDFWNFKDALIVASHNWLWLLAAVILGFIVGWVTCRRVEAR